MLLLKRIHTYHERLKNILLFYINTHLFPYLERAIWSLLLLIFNFSINLFDMSNTGFQTLWILLILSFQCLVSNGLFWRWQTVNNLFSKMKNEKVVPCATSIFWTLKIIDVYKTHLWTFLYIFAFKIVLWFFSTWMVVIRLSMIVLIPN